MGLLNLNQFNLTERQKRTLEEEVDEYLLDSRIGTSALNFWQVRYTLPFARLALY